MPRRDGGEEEDACSCCCQLPKRVERSPFSQEMPLSSWEEASVRMRDV